MNAATRAARPRWRGTGNRELWRIVALAACLHALLLLVPARRNGAPPAARPIEVRLATPQPASPRAPADPGQANPPITMAVAAEATPPSVDPAATTRAPAAEPPRPRITAAMLREAVRQMPWPDPQAPARALGVARIPELPGGLARPVLPVRRNLFDPYMVPERPLVLDQWVNASGVVEAVIRAPDGNTYCGRGEPWDPMNPLVEHVAMYRACGGGGPRKPAGPFASRDGG